MVLSTTPSGLRYPEDGDSPDGPLAFQNLTTDIERALKGSASVPTVATGWAWYGTSYGEGIEMRMGRVVTVDGMLKRTGASITLQASPATVVPILTIRNVPDASRSFTGAAFMPTLGQACRWFIAGGSNSLGILHPGGAGTYTFATNAVLAINFRWIMAA